MLPLAIVSGEPIWATGKIIRYFAKRSSGFLTSARDIKGSEKTITNTAVYGSVRLLEDPEKKAVIKRL